MAVQNITKTVKIWPKQFPGPNVCLFLGDPWNSVDFQRPPTIHGLLDPHSSQGRFFRKKKRSLKKSNSFSWLFTQNLVKNGQKLI